MRKFRSKNTLARQPGISNIGEEWLPESSKYVPIGKLDAENSIRKHERATEKDHRLHNRRLIDVNGGKRPYQAWFVAGPEPNERKGEFVMRAGINRDLDVFLRIGDICRVAMLCPPNTSPVFHNAERTDGSLVGLGVPWRDTMEFKVSVTSSLGFDVPTKDLGTIFQYRYEGEAFSADCS